MRWLDVYIDRMRESTATWTGGFVAELGPYSRVGSVVNVLMCAGIGVAFLVTGLGGGSFGLAPLIIPIALEMLFVRVCVRAFRGDFDDEEPPRR